MKMKTLQKIDLTGALEAVKRGDPIIFPTETVYGLGASIFDEKALQSIFSLKKRPPDNPLIVHVADIEDVAMLSDELNENFHRLAKAFWPGPLALIVKKKGGISSLISAGLPTVAIRMPSHPVAQELLRLTGPLAAPSANLSGRPSPTCLSDALEDFSVSVAIDGGECELGLESTVLNLVGAPTLLRPGSITQKDLEKELGIPILSASDKDPPLSPGMKYRHYAPKARIELISQMQPGALLPNAKSFYADLRRADREGKEEIKIYCSQEVLEDAALMNRLLKAAGK